VGINDCVSVSVIESKRSRVSARVPYVKMNASRRQNILAQEEFAPEITLPVSLYRSVSFITHILESFFSSYALTTPCTITDSWFKLSVAVISGACILQLPKFFWWYAELVLRIIRKRFPSREENLLVRLNISTSSRALRQQTDGVTRLPATAVLRMVL
jgi:hypothetical protein